ncbi:hypothetical protein AQUCO_01000582v1 [Aquilegia coerulea]|uniref:Tetrapyrrole methylase domain-containing protein n=1 Tax=Aquilegia coerulea TaxID=218851 RepID=A0A2G5EAR0_AQUCA|nr:hypothetical protein AQUCO_01000582v1 [Aquilegia coerulea]
MRMFLLRLSPPSSSLSHALSWPTSRPLNLFFSASKPISSFSFFNSKFNKNAIFNFSSSTSLEVTATTEPTDFTSEIPFKGGPLKSGLYLVATPIGNLEDITFRALRVLKSADVILSEDTRHSWKLLQHYSIKTPLLSYHKFNETHREETILKRLQQGEIVALISDAGTPGISDPGTELAKLCVKEKIPVIPIPGASALVAALSASGLSTMEFTFVGFLPKHAPSRKERLLVSAKETVTQIFYVPPHKLKQFLEETCPIFGDSSSGEAL